MRVRRFATTGTWSAGNRLLDVYTVLVYVFLFAPIFFVVVLSFGSQMFSTFPPKAYSLHWYWKLFHHESLMQAARTSLALGACASVISTTIGTMAAMAFVRYRFPGKNLLNTLMLSPVVVPEVVTGIALLLFLRFLQQPQSFSLLLLGHVMLTLPYTILVVQARLYGFSRTVEEAALSLGANEFQTFFTITLPLILPGVLAALLFAFTISWDDITATLFWASPSSQTIPIKIWAMLKFSISPEINALGTILLAVTIAGPLVAGYFARRRVT